MDLKPVRINLSYYAGRSQSDLYYSRYETIRIRNLQPWFGRDVLDYGAGDSFHLDLITQNHSCQGWALEPNQLARDELQAKGYTTYARPEEIDRQFDTVFLSHVIEHISPGKIYPFFSDLVNLIKPGGNCLIISPISKWFWDTPDHYRKYNRKAIGCLFRENNLVEDLCLYQGSQNVCARVLRILRLRETIFQQDCLLRCFFRLSNLSHRDLIISGRKPQ